VPATVISAALKGASADADPSPVIGLFVVFALLLLAWGMFGHHAAREDESAAAALPATPAHERGAAARRLLG
jgi:cytochrome b